MNYIDISWPEGEEALSDEAVHAITVLLNFKPEERANADGTTLTIANTHTKINS